MRELVLEVPGGVIAVQDYGGPQDAPSVLFVHGVGLCGPNWARVGEALSDRVHSYSFDLPGHAHSSVPMTCAADMWRCLPDIVEMVGLTRPVLVGHDTGSWVAMIGALRFPDLFSATVLVGGSAARTTDETQSYLDLVKVPEFRARLVTQLHVGERGQGQESADALAAVMSELTVKDWMLPQSPEGMLSEVAHSIVMNDDGSWVHTPTLRTLENGYAYEPGPDYPDEHLYGRLRVPTYLVQLTEGYDSNLAGRERQLAAMNPLLRVEMLISGQWPQYTAVPELAGLIARAAGA